MILHSCKLTRFSFLLLHAAGLGAESGSSDEAEARDPLRQRQQQQQQQRLLELCDTLLFQPGGGSWDAAALVRLKEQLLQRPPLGEAGGAAQDAATEGGGIQQQAQQGEAMQVEAPLQQAQRQVPERGESPSAFDLLMQQASALQQAPSPAQPPSQQQQQQHDPSAFELLLSQRPPGEAQAQQASPPLFMSQADDNMAAPQLPQPASQQAEAGQGPAAGSDASPGAAFLIGTEASQPDPMQQAALQPLQELQRELLERRQQQQERRQQQRDQQRQAAAEAAAAAAAQEQQQEVQPAAEGEVEGEEDPLRGRQLAAASAATHQFVWDMLGEPRAAGY